MAAENGHMAGITVTQHIAHRLRQVRLQRGWSARQLAEETAKRGARTLSRSTIAKIEAGVRKSITADELTVLADTLSVPVSELMTLASPQERLARIATLVYPCPPPYVHDGYDRCPRHPEQGWPCAYTEIAWLAQGLDVATETRAAFTQKGFDHAGP